MTRETKVGLLVGMGVILLVGIIVSDHLATVGEQNSATMTDYAQQTQQGIGDQPVDNSDRDRSYRPGGATTVHRDLLLTPGDLHRRQEQQRRQEAADQMREIRAERITDLNSEPGESIRGFGNGNRAPEQSTFPGPTSTESDITPQRKEVLVLVRSGQTYSELAAEYLGSSKRWRELFEANKDQVSHPTKLRAGMKIRIPGSAVATSTGNHLEGRSTRPTAASTYTVRQGDTLYAIARQKLGNGAQWRKILTANKGKIDDADMLKVGTKLRIPH